MPRNGTTPAAREPRSSFVSLLSGWVQQGVESFLATQRILVDLAMRQNATAINSIRRELTKEESKAASKNSPRNILVEMAVEGTANYIEAQRILLDLAQKENEVVLRGVRERVGANETAAGVTNVVGRGIDTFIEMQHNFLTLVSKATENWIKNAGDFKEMANYGPVCLANDAMKEFVVAQKKFLDVVAEETSKSAGKKEHKKIEHTDLVELGREATESFVEAQKKMLDLAGQQMNVSTQALGRVLEVRAPIRLAPMLNVLGDGVKSVVDAERALVDNMAKARKRPAPVEAAAAKRTTRRKPAKRRARATAGSAA
jgi:hypothetical protein